MQLVAYGAQDIYLTGNPQITFFKVVYRRHTNFSMETIQQTISGSSTLSGSTSTGTVTISRNGDLVHKVYVTSSTAGIQNGDNLVQEVEIEIGGQKIDKQTKEWMQVWEELNTPGGNKGTLKHMKHAQVLGHQHLSTELTATTAHNAVGMVQIPLRFWFCRNPGLALPLIALQYHEVKLKFTWGVSKAVTSANFETSVAGTAADCEAVCKVWCDYIYLDTDERRRFAQVSHEYLIEQVQEQSASGATSNKLNFNHPVKELIWTDTVNTDYVDAKLQLNGHDRFAAQEEEYFQLRQPYEYHTSTPTTNVVPIRTNALGFWQKSFTADTSGADGTAEFDSDATTNLDLYMDGTGENEWYPHVGDKYTIEVKDAGVVKKTVTTRITAVTATGTAGKWAHYSDSDANHFVLTTEDAWTEGVTMADADTIEVTVSERAEVFSTCNSLIKQINCYSFALKPEEHQPSGTCNFSRIDNAKLIFSTAPAGTLYIYAVNYNVLRIMSGMGGLAYSN